MSRRDKNPIRVSAWIQRLSLGVLCLSPLGCSRVQAAPTPRTQSTTATPRTTAAEQPRTPYEADLRRIDQLIAARMQRAEARTDNWIDLEFAASSYVERARLSGDYEDYVHARDLLDRAFRVAPQGSGPLLTRAAFNYSLHRLSQASADLDVIERQAYVVPDHRSRVAQLRADIAFHAGRYDEALRGYQSQLERDRSLPTLVALAQYRWKTGAFAEATTLLEEAAQQARASGAPSDRAWLSLVRGLLELDRGRYEQALEHYETGLRVLPGWWLLEEHIAEIHTLTGRPELAIREYQSLIERTGNPEFIDALAEIHTERGNHAAARALITRARSIHDRRLALFPEATYGHALEHYLRFEPDTAQAVRLAEGNRDARPGGEAQTRLAQAYLRAGRLDDARRVIDAAVATVWNTAELHATASLVHDALGNTAAAMASRNRALALNPHAMDDVAWLRPARR